MIMNRDSDSKGKRSPFRAAAPLLDTGNRIVAQSIQQPLGVRIREQQITVNIPKKSFRQSSVGHLEQRIVVSIDIEYAARLALYAELRPSQHLEEFLPRPVSAGQSHERVRKIRHERLALMHRADNAQLRQSHVGNFPVGESLRDHSDNVPSLVQ